MIGKQTKKCPLFKTDSHGLSPLCLASHRAQAPKDTGHSLTFSPAPVYGVQAAAACALPPEAPVAIPTSSVLGTSGATDIPAAAPTPQMPAVGSSAHRRLLMQGGNASHFQKHLSLWKAPIKKCLTIELVQKCV